MSPRIQGLIGATIPVAGLALGWLGFDTAFARSGAVLVAFAVVAARSSYGEWVNYTQRVSANLVAMRDEYQQRIFNASIVAEFAGHKNDENLRVNAIENAENLAEQYNALKSQFEKNTKLNLKVSRLHKRALTIDTCMVVVGTLIWGFGDLLTSQACSC